MKFAFVSLGCTKNQVDSEMLIDFFKKQSFEVTNDAAEADIIAVNTCGFIESAKNEAISVILEMADYKINGKCKHLFVFGCLAKRYKNEIIKNLPEVDLVVGVDEYKDISKILSNYFETKMSGNLDYRKRTIISNFPTCYIRISDGCENKCAFCAIPGIRGEFKSRKIEDILEEVRFFAEQGMEEFVIISQDTSKYGRDIYGTPCLEKLLREISKIEGVKWIRILYMYLYEVTDELIKEIKENDKICKYFDVPIQHLSNNMLKAMLRKDSKELIYSKISKIREEIPEAVIRTTVIVGFPGETENDFLELLNGIKELKFDRLGAFSYSPEEGTKAATFKNQIDEEVKKERLEKIYEAQKEISLSLNEKRVGSIFEVLIDDVSEDNNYFVARSYMDSPDVDGRILIKIDENSIKKVIVGDFTKVIITDFSQYDLYGEII